MKRKWFKLSLKTRMSRQEPTRNYFSLLAEGKHNDNFGGLEMPPNFFQIET